MIKELCRMFELFNKIQSQTSFFSILGLRKIGDHFDSIRRETLNLSKVIKQTKKVTYDEDGDTLICNLFRPIQDIGCDFWSIRKLLAVVLDKRRKFDPSDQDNEYDRLVINKGLKLNIVYLLRASLDICEKINSIIGVEIISNCDLTRARKDITSLSKVIKDLDCYLDIVNQSLPRTRRQVSIMIKNLTGFILFIEKYIETIDHSMHIMLNSSRLYEENMKPELGTRFERMDGYEYRVSYNRMAIFDN